MISDSNITPGKSMGNSQSIRETHFQRTDTADSPSEKTESNEQYISISNKMVERLVEDATLTGKAAASETTIPRDDYKEKVFMEKLLYLDENHSQRFRLTVEDLNETAARIELRTANMVCVEPVCAECKQRVIDCYDSGPHTESLVCWDAVGHATCTEQKAPLGNHARDPMVAPMPSFCAFTKCVQTAAAKRLHARTQRDAREHARRERHVAHAREHALKDLTPPAPQETTA
ncbi:unnamed protein product [Parnassius apollo]|uniref:(apollo) hypothetical protein n=1 Tax=Parnassius apollo TaxID=110799 RepID=A0A8S3XW76_PARAO|nr:unnamed protein product [Parnassius apollo]